MARVTGIRESILVALCFSRNLCLSLNDLARHCGVETARMEQLLEELEERRLVEHRGKKYCLHENALSIPSILIARNVYETKEERTTKDVARDVDMDYRRVYQVCRRFEASNYFARGEPVEVRRFFAPIIGEIMHPGNYDLIMDSYRQLRNIVKNYKPGDPGLIRRIIDAINEKIRRVQPERRKESMRTFESELVNVAKTATTRSEIYDVLGIKPTIRESPTWKPFGR